jgi:hypothetical protein
MLLSLMQLASVLSFKHTTFGLSRVRESWQLQSVSAEAPTTLNSRLRVTISGPSISTALFRAELKKELCFFRGCRASFVTPDSLSGVSELICEGRTQQISRFLVWLEALSVEISSRKANFQGPSLLAYIDKVAWEEYQVSVKKMMIKLMCDKYESFDSKRIYDLFDGLFLFVHVSCMLESCLRLCFYDL